MWKSGSVDGPSDKDIDERSVPDFGEFGREV